MQNIWDIINRIGESIADIWEFIENLFEWLGIAIDYIITAINLCYEFIIGFPVWIKGFAMATILIATVYTVIGRQGGNSE